MTPRQRVETVLAGGHADVVPFTMYEKKVHPCRAERDMRNRGMCIVHRMSVYKTHRPNVRVTASRTCENGKPRVRTVYQTPAGTLSTLDEPAGFTTWHREKMFKGPEDYKALRALIADEQYEPDYGPFAEREAAFAGDAICRAAIGAEPLQALISGSLMDMTDFCIEWMERRDEVLALYELLIEKRRQVYPIVADSPAGHANYGGNVVPEIVGLETFQTCYAPHYNEAAEALHARGKKLGSHFDANCRLLAEAIAATELDFIEAFTPAPDSDMTLAQARDAWPNKVLWVNFPSSLHLADDARIERTTVEMLDSIPAIDGLLMGITEDVPPDRWRDSCRAIQAGLARHAVEHPALYA